MLKWLKGLFSSPDEDDQQEAEPEDFSAYAHVDVFPKEEYDARLKEVSKENKKKIRAVSRRGGMPNASIEKLKLHYPEVFLDEEDEDNN